MFAQDPTGGCPCDCDEIITQDHSYNDLLIRKVTSDCFEFNVNVTGCGGRTVKGFTLELIELWSNDCLNQNWSIMDLNTGQPMGVYNPSVVQPTFGLFIPPVGPCETRSFNFQICMEDAGLCDHQDFEGILNFIFDDDDLPCPLKNNKVVFNSPMNLKNENLENDNQNITMKQEKNNLTLNALNLDNSRTIEIYDITNRLIFEEQFYNNTKIINLDAYMSGMYIIYIKESSNVIFKNKFLVVK